MPVLTALVNNDIIIVINITGIRGLNRMAYLFENTYWFRVILLPNVPRPT